MKGGFLGEGAVLFQAAKIGGDLNCAGSTFRNRRKNGSGGSLDCSSAEIVGNVLLGYDFPAEGTVYFPAPG